MPGEKKVTSVLIVDDSPEDRAAWTRMLERQEDRDFRVRETDGGEAGLDAWRAERPDCILLDYNLPDLDGLEFLAQMKVEDPRQTTPVVVLTGMGNEAVAVEAMKRGARDYLAKGSITPVNLRRAIDNAIEKASMQRLIERSRKDLERRGREAQEYADALSYDLGRTLKIIAGQLEALDRKGADDEGRKTVARAQEAADLMARLIEDLGAYSRVGAAGERLEAVNCDALVAGVLGELRGRIESLGASVTREALPTVVGDGAQLHQLFRNLLMNALDFEGARPVEVHIGVSYRPGEWTFTVRD
ncbi:MAG: response regulator, partial [Candidatus Methylomirabilis sp.]|nr:response regulator [Deltaproteobacteria bacterium]